MRLVSSLLDSAPSVLQRMTVDKPLGLSPNRHDISYRGDFGGANCLKNPFHPASEAARNFRPGYSWPPHLYQERFQFIGAQYPSQGSAPPLRLRRDSFGNMVDDTLDSRNSGC